MGQVNIDSTGTHLSRLSSFDTGLVLSLHGGRQSWLARMFAVAGWERDHRV